MRAFRTFEYKNDEKIKGWNYFDQSDYNDEDDFALSSNDKGFHKIGRKFKKSEFKLKAANDKITKSSDLNSRTKLRSVRPLNTTAKKPDKLFACIKHSGNLGKCVEVWKYKY